MLEEFHVESITRSGEETLRCLFSSHRGKKLQYLSFV